MLRVLTTAGAAGSSAEDVAVLLETHCTAGLTDQQVIIMFTHTILNDYKRLSVCAGRCTLIKDQWYNRHQFNVIGLTLSQIRFVRILARALAGRRPQTS